MAKTCPACNGAVMRLDDRCPHCDAKLVADKPWYLWAIGGAIVALLFFAVGSPAALVRFVENLATLLPR